MFINDLLGYFGLLVKYVFKTLFKKMDVLYYVLPGMDSKLLQI